MATAGRDGVVKLWDLDDGTQLMALSEQGPPISSLDFSPDGRYLAAIDAELIRDDANYDHLKRQESQVNTDG